MTRCFVVSDEDRRTITARDSADAALRAARRQKGHRIFIWLSDIRPRHGAPLPEPFYFVRVIRNQHAGQ